jgi:hypothetical protein
MSAALKLYELGQQYQSLERLVESDDLPAEVIKDTLEGIEGSFEAKAVAVAKFILSLEASAEAIARAATQMTGRANRIQNRADSIRAYLLFWMQATEKKRIESPEFVIARRANPPAVHITDEKAIPPQFWVQPDPPAPRLDKKKLKVALDAGERVEGAYVEAGEKLEIKL